MRKPIGTRLHGALDYLSVGTLLVLPRALGWDKGTTRLLTGSALATLVYSVLTDYELGVVRVLPMKAHLALDGLSAATLLAAPLLLGDGRGEKLGLLGLGLFETSATLLSQTESPTEAQDGVVTDSRWFGDGPAEPATPSDREVTEAASVAHA